MADCPIEECKSAKNMKRRGDSVSIPFENLLGPDCIGIIGAILS